MAQYSRSQLRDVLVEFYTRVDPSRLEGGVDINGMCDWILNCGPGDINAKLRAKYGGRELDFSILDKRVEQVGALTRMSRALPSDFAVERDALERRLHSFYSAHDASKLNNIAGFVDWISLHSVPAFNKLLAKKYGKDLESVKEEEEAQPPAPELSEESKLLAAATAPSNRMPIKTLMGAPIRPLPKPPKAAMAKTPVLVEAAVPIVPETPVSPVVAASPAKPKATTPPLLDLVSQLKLFYLHHGEANPDPLAAARWAEVVGMDQFNAKLMQLYGGDLNTLAQDQLQPKPLPAIFSPASSQETAGNVQPSPTVPAASAASGSKPQQQRKRSPSEGCCDNYQLDLTGESFGVCVCGFSRAAHAGKKKQPGTTTATAAVIATKAQAEEEEEPIAGETVPWSFDAETFKLFELMVAGYEAQTNTKANQAKRVAWATALVPLTQNRDLKGELVQLPVLLSSSTAQQQQQS